MTPQHPEPGEAVSHELPGWRHTYSGKVRDLYEPAGDGADSILMVASDRVSAFDYALEPPIPGKGAVLTSLSRWWFERLDVPNHVLSADAVSEGGLVPDSVAGRAMVVKRLDMHPIECVVRGFLSGSAWVEYQRSQSVCGVPLPAGLEDGDALTQPIYTPAWKAPAGQHDENITFERTVELVGAAAAEALRETSLSVFRDASARALERGLILADTKFEFGVDAEGTLTLADEVLTPDSSRYWDLAAWRAGERGASFDKQFVRDWLTSSGWDRHGDAPPPPLPDDVVERTRARYLEAYERLTGAPLTLP